MTMDLRIEQLDDLTIYEVSGIIDADRIETAIRDFYDSVPTNDVLWEFRRADFSAIWMDEIKRLAKATIAFSESRPAGRSALVFDADVGYGLGRIFGTIQETDDSPVRYRIFRTRDEALTWLAAS